jgi:ABC-type bacteriocin/lantibiotic exporter with double-glycine peptidase domain
LVIVIGAVGSGKSTLLYSLMHETSLTSGTHSQNGTLAYVEQEPFIFSASVKDNIIFGLPFDEERFNYAIEVS